MRQVNLDYKISLFFLVSVYIYYPLFKHVGFGALSTQNVNNTEDEKGEKQLSKQNIQIGVFTGNYKNDGVSGEFDGLTYPHSREMLKVKYCTRRFCNIMKL